MVFKDLDLVRAVMSIAAVAEESRFVELSHAHTDKLSITEFRDQVPKLLDVASCFGIVLKVMHMPTYLCEVESADDVGKVLECAYEWLDAAHDLGIDIVVLHTLYVRRGASTYTPKWLSECIEINRKFLHRLSQRARRLGVLLALENRVEKWLVGNTATDLVEIIQGIDGVGVCFDLGHAHASGYDLAEFHEILRNYIVAYHIHDNDGSRDQHLLPLLGTIDWNTMRRIMMKDKPMVFEISCRGKQCTNYIKLIDTTYKNLLHNP